MLEMTDKKTKEDAFASSRRIVWVDVLRGIGIVLVIFWASWGCAAWTH